MTTTCKKRRKVSNAREAVRTTCLLNIGEAPAQQSFPLNILNMPPGSHCSDGESTEGVHSTEYHTFQRGSPCETKPVAVTNRSSPTPPGYEKERHAHPFQCYSTSMGTSEGNDETVRPKFYRVARSIQVIPTLAPPNVETASSRR